MDLKLAEDQTVGINLNQLKEKIGLKIIKRPRLNGEKRGFDLLALPAHNTAYCDHAAFENDDQF